MYISISKAKKIQRMGQGIYIYIYIYLVTFDTPLKLVHINHEQNLLQI